MKKFSKLLALLLAVLFVIAACGSPAAEVPAATPTPTPAATPTPTPAPAPDVDDVVEITFHYTWGGNVFNPEWSSWIAAQEETGVRLEGVANPLFTTPLEEFNLQAVVGFPAHLYAGSFRNQFMEFGMQGAFIPLNDLLPVYAPTFYDLMTRFPELRAAITAPDGNIYHLPGMNDVLEDIASGRNYWIRQDWLDILGLDAPDTIEELEQVLIAFRDEMPAHTGNDVVFPIIGSDMSNLLNMLVPFWGGRTAGSELGSRIVPAADGSTLYNPWLTEEFRTAIENISRWYQEGLIDYQIFTRGGGFRQELFASNQGAFTYHFPLSTGDFNHIIREIHPEFSLVAIIPPLNVNGERISEHQRPLTNFNGWGISHNNPNPERTLQFIDFFYTRRGRDLQSFGTEGITFEYDAGGNPVFLPRIWEQGVPGLDYIRWTHGAVQDGIGRWPDIRFEHQMGGPETLEAMLLYEANGSFAPRMLPLLPFNHDELDTVNSITPHLHAYLNEHVQSFILGDWENISNQWDEFVEGAIALGAHELLEAYQSAFDRFLTMN